MSGDEFQVTLKRTAEKDLRKIPEEHREDIETVLRLFKNGPFPQGIRVEKLRYRENSFRIRKGMYRILYEYINDSSKIVVFGIPNRKDAYK